MDPARAWDPERLVLRTGGQSGVDRAVLDFAVERGIPYAGWCPRGGWAEDLTEPPGLLERYPQLTPTPSADPRQRTAWNVRDSHASVFVAFGDPAAVSPGSDFARVCTELVFPQALLLVDPRDAGAGGKLARWWRETSEEISARPAHLGIGGPRESEAPGIYRATLELLREAVRVDGSLRAGLGTKKRE